MYHIYIVTEVYSSMHKSYMEAKKTAIDIANKLVSSRYRCKCTDNMCRCRKNSKLVINVIIVSDARVLINDPAA